MIRAARPQGKPQVLLFDLGGVLVHLNTVDRLWIETEPAQGTMPFCDRWSVSQAVSDYETGRLENLEAFWQAARAEMGLSIEAENFTQAFISIIGEPFAETKPLLTVLGAHYPLMLLSNTNEAHWRYCRDELGLAVYFQQLFLSYEMGVMKPDERIYRQFLAGTGEDPQNIYYFDDRIENVEAACRVGIRGRFCTGGPELVADLLDLGVLESD